MNPYKVDIKKLTESEKIIDESEVLKLRLAAEFIRVTESMSTEEILKTTGLHKSDLSRLKAGNADRFSIARLVALLANLGFTTTVKVKKNRAS